MHTVREFPRWVRVVFTAGVTFLAVSVVAIATNPVAHSYEISFFEAYPLWFWGALVSVVLLGQALILSNARDTSAEYWKLGFGLAGAANIVLLLHPHVRYVLYGRGDVLTHIGSVRHIVKTGTFMNINYYPVTHMLAAMLTELGMLSPVKATSILPALFSLVYIASYVYLVRYLAPNRLAFLFATSIGTLLPLGVGHMYTLPSAVSFFFAPLIAYLYLALHDSPQFRTYAVVFVFLVVISVPFHPLSYLYILTILLTFRTVHAIAPRVENFSLDVPSAVHSPTLLLGIVLSLWWYSGSTPAVRSAVNILGPFLGELEGGRFSHLTSVASTYSPSLLDIVTVGLFSYGRLGLVIGLTGVVLCVHLLRRWQQGRAIRSSVVALGIVYGVFVGLTAAAFFLDFLISYNRLARPVYFAAPLLIGFGTASLFRDMAPRRRQALLGIFVCLLSVLLVLSVVGLHSSPITKDNNKQVTEMELRGSEWYYDNRDRSLLTDELGFKQFRFYGATGDGYTRDGSFEGLIRLPQQNIRFRGTGPPDHFGYENNATLGASYGEDRYLVVTELGRERYPKLYPDYEESWRFHPDDFRQLERDSTVDRVYDNGEFDLYYVHG